MKILQIASLIPYPVNDGGRAGIYNITQQFKKRGVEIHFAAPSINSNDVNGFSKGITVHLLDVNPKNSISGMFWNLFSNEPYNIGKYYSKAAFQQLDNIVARGHFDAIHTDSLHLAKYAVKLKQKYNIPIVLREHNFEAEIMHRFSANVHNPLLRYYAKLQYKRVFNYEAMIVSQFDVVIPITEEDEVKLKRAAQSVQSIAIPAGVNFDDLKFAPSNIDNRVLFLTNFNWYPNQDSYDYYQREILPSLLRINPDVKTIVVGKGTLENTRKIIGKGIEVIGFVDDINEASSLASIAVVPLRIGSGMRIKILELMAMGIVVITTSIGAEGIKLVHGKHAFIIDDPVKFADCIAYLLQSPEVVQRTAKAARLLVEEKYSWDSIGQKLYEVYEDLLYRHK